MYNEAFHKLITLILLLILIGCRSDSLQNSNQEAQKVGEHKSISVNETDLLEEVRVFLFDEGETGENAWKKLKAYPYMELTDTLSRMQHSTSDDIVRANIAFVFCNLDFDYQTNRAVIVSTFNKSIENAGIFERPIHRLIERGDKSLLQVLFAIVSRSDGHLSEEIADTFADQMQNHPEEFLTELKLQPRKIRREVYELIIFGMSDEDRIKQFLKTVPKKSSIAEMAKEMSLKLSHIER